MRMSHVVPWTASAAPSESTKAMAIPVEPSSTPTSRQNVAKPGNP